MSEQITLNYHEATAPSRRIMEILRSYVGRPMTESLEVDIRSAILREPDVRDVKVELFRLTGGITASVTDAWGSEYVFQVFPRRSCQDHSFD